MKELVLTLLLLVLNGNGLSGQQLPSGAGNIQQNVYQFIKANQHTSKVIHFTIIVFKRFLFVFILKKVQLKF